MMEKEKINVMGLVGMILGILAVVISFVPCLGVYAIYPGIVGIIFSALGLRKVKKGMAIAGLVCSLLGTGIATWQFYTIKQGVEELNKDMEKFNNEYPSAPIE
jgi:hypothetical protein